MKTFKSPWLWCCVALPLLLAGCNTGFSKQEVNSMRALTPKQRDQLGQELATELRRTSLGDQGKYYLRDIRYRNSDDTLVYDMEMKSLDNFRQLDAANRKEAKRKGDQLVNQIVCENRKTRSVVMDARLGIEFRMKNSRGVELMRPRVVPGGCS